MVDFVLSILFVLTLVSDMTVLYGNDALSTKKAILQFFEKGFHYPENLL